MLEAVPIWSLGYQSILVAYQDDLALTFLALHVVSGIPPSTRRKSSDQVPNTYPSYQDTLIGPEPGHTCRHPSRSWAGR